MHLKNLDDPKRKKTKQILNNLAQSRIKYFTGSPIIHAVSESMTRCRFLLHNIHEYLFRLRVIMKFLEEVAKI